MSIRNLISANLTARLKAKRWSQQELFRRSGVSQATIGRIIRKEVDPDIETVSRLAEKLGCKAWELLAPENLHKQVGNDISTTPNIGAGDNVDSPDSFRVREAEMPLILMFRKLSPQERGEVLGTVATKFYGDDAEPEPIPGAKQIRGYDRNEHTNAVGAATADARHRKGTGKTVK